MTTSKKLPLRGIIKVISDENDEQYNITPTTQKSQKVLSRQAVTELLEKHLHNIRQILFYTNATPIRTFDGVGYCCGYCIDRFSTPAELKRHTQQSHDHTDKEHYMEGVSLSKISFKIDITDFKCVLCDCILDNLEGAITHLKTLHDKEYYDDIDNHILAFTFDSEGVTCSVCLNVYFSFKLAVEHMHSHYGNYLCDICSAPFNNKCSLNNHVQRHKRGDFACRFCDKVYDTSFKRNAHEKFTHKGYGWHRNKCPHCGEKFDSYKKKIDHEVEMHGREPIQFKCMACDRIFQSRTKLNHHTRQYHLLERSHSCGFCDKSFYTSGMLKTHMQKHTELKEYMCIICFKAFCRKQALREHMKIHDDDNSYKCKFCSQTFTDNYNLKNHMRAKHSTILHRV